MFIKKALFFLVSLLCAGVFGGLIGVMRMKVKSSFGVTDEVTLVLAMLLAGLVGLLAAYVLKRTRAVELIFGVDIWNK